MHGPSHLIVYRDRKCFEKLSISNINLKRESLIVENRFYD